MKELIFKFKNPYCSSEDVLFHKETKRYYILQPVSEYDVRLLTCTPHKGYYEADCPVKAGLTYLIHGNVVTTREDGIIRNEERYLLYMETEIEVYQVKDEFKDIPNNSRFKDTLLTYLHSYLDPNHFDKLTVKRKDVCRMGDKYYFN